MCMRGYNLYTTCKLIILFLLSASVNQYPFEDGVTHTLHTISSSYYRVVASDANLVVLITMVCNSYYMLQKFYLGKFTL